MFLFTLLEIIEIVTLGFDYIIDKEIIDYIIK